MRELNQSFDPSAEASARAARLAPYLGAALADAVVAPAPPKQALYLAASHLAGVRYTVATYLPRLVAERALREEPTRPWLEWVEGSLLFADVSGSTALAERLSAAGREGSELVTATINDYFGGMLRRIQEAGGDLLSFGGDGLLVLFDGPEHARDATVTAMALLHESAALESTSAPDGPPLGIHVGVAAGRVALVSAGQPHALRYGTMGRTVAAVARAEGLSERGELVLDPAAWSLVAADAQGEPIAESGGFVRVRAIHGRTPLAAPTNSPPPAPALTLEALDRLADLVRRLSPYLPADLLARIVADPTRPRVEADLRPVTVLFAQVSGLGPLIDGLPPAEAAASVDAFLQPMQAIVERFGGFVNKLDLGEEGDKLMAVFGAPTALEDHAERAARAALAMQTALGLGLDGLKAALRLRIGLNTGTVFAGNVGTPERREYTVMGDAVNVAARAMAHAAWGEIRASAATAAQIGTALLTGDPQSVRVRGRREPVELLRLVGERERTMALGRAGPLIGRERELSWLREQLAETSAGRGRALLVAGEAGIGKSRLAATLLNEARSAGAVAVSVRCLAFNSAAPYAAWGEIVRDLCGISVADSQPERARKLGEALAAAGVPPDDWLSLVADLARLDAEESAVVRALDPQQRQARRFELVLALLKAAATGNLPAVGQAAALILLLDNLHHADRISLDLWRSVAAQIDDVPLLLLGLHRGPLPWGDVPAQAAAIELGPLSAEASHAVLNALAVDGPLAPELRERLVARAVGNPLFLEELLRAVERGGAAVDALPDSLSGLLLARIDRLDERSRTLLRVAAVVGQRFPVGVVQSVHERDYAELLGRLAQLDAEELTALERDRPERVHIFRHGLLQEVAYQSLLFARRRELHRRIGAHLEERYSVELAAVRAEYNVDGDTPLIQVGRNGALLRREARANGAPIFLIAHHFRLSDAPERAAPYLLLAGHLARDSYANEQAIQHYRWALEAMGEGDRRAWEAREALGDVLAILGRYDEARAEYEALLAEELPAAVAAEVLRSLGDALEKQGRYADALEKLHAAEARCQAELNAVPPLLLSAIAADTGQVLRRLGRFDEALDVCRNGLAMLRHDRRSREDERIEAELQLLIATLFAMRGEYEPARFHFENALAAQESIDDLYGCARSHNNLGYLAQLQSDYDRAVRHYGEAETLARKVSSKYILSSVLLNAAYCYFCLDRYDEAESSCHDAVALSVEMSDQDSLAKCEDLLGNVAYNRGDYQGALDHYDLALNIHTELGSAYQEGNTQAMRSSALIALGDYQTAKAALDAARAIAQQIEAPQLQLEVSNIFVELALARLPLLPSSHHEPLLSQLEGELQSSYALVEQLGSRLERGISIRLAAEVAFLRGDSSELLLDAAETEFTAINSSFEMARTWAVRAWTLAAQNLPAAERFLKQAEATFKQIGAEGELRRLAAKRERNE